MASSTLLRPLGLRAAAAIFRGGVTSVSLAPLPTSSALQSSRPFSASAVDAAKYKLKTHSGTAKRWWAVGNGKWKRARPNKSHLNTSFSASHINRLSLGAYALPGKMTRRLRRLLPNA